MKFLNASEVFEQMNSAYGQQYLFAVDFELDEGFFILNPKESSDVLWRVGQYSNFSKEESKPVRRLFEPHPITFEQYKAQFDIVAQGLQSGNSFLTNLTIRTPIACDYTLDEIARHSNSQYLLMVNDNFVCFSPETFVKISDQGVISSNPMKGTIDANVENALQKLMDDSKEQAEHNTIVDLIRNDLSIVANKVTVAKFRYAEKIETLTGDIIQTSSEIQGNLDKESLKRIGDVFKRLLPAGSVSGAPKESTLNIIREAESRSRGFYCGVFGYSNGKQIDSAVMIRYIKQSGKQYYFDSGSGITANSIAKAEYEECVKKIYLPFELK